MCMCPDFAAWLAMLTMRPPPPWRIICRAACRVQRKAPVRFTFEYRAPAVGRRVEQRLHQEPGVARIVCQDVEPAEGLDRARDRRLHLRLVGHVERKREHFGSRGPAGRPLRAQRLHWMQDSRDRGRKARHLRPDDYPATVVREPCQDRLTEPARTACACAESDPALHAGHETVPDTYFLRAGALRAPPRGPRPWLWSRSPPSWWCQIRSPFSS